MEEETDWSQTSHSDQRSCVKIETLRRKNPAKIQNALHEVSGDSVVDSSTVSWWASRFCEGRVSIQDDPRCWRPVTAMHDTSVVIVSTLSEDQRKSCEENVHEANMSTASVFRIMTQTSQKRKVTAKWVPHQLRKEQKAARKRVAEELLRCYEAEGEQFLNGIVAIDETWIGDTTTEILVLSVEACNFSSPEKMLPPTIESKLMIIMAYGKRME